MRFFILILITISLNACNINLPDYSSGCKQKGLEDKFKEVYLYQILTPMPSFYSYIKYGFRDKVKFDVTNVVETQISENRNVRSCEATLGIKLPIPVSKTIPDDFRSWIMGLASGLYPADSQRSLQALTGEYSESDKIEYISGRVKYTVSKIIDAESDKKVDIALEIDKEIFPALMYRLNIIRIDDLTKAFDSPSNQSKQIHWNESQIREYLDDISKNPRNNLAQEKCVIEKVNNEHASIDSYMAWLSFALMSMEDFKAKIFYGANPTLQRWQKSMTKITDTCDQTAKQSVNDTQNTNIQKNTNSESNVSLANLEKNQSIVSKYFKKEVLPTNVNNSSVPSNNFSNNEESKISEKTKPNHGKLKSIFEYKTNNSCTYKEESFERQVSLKVNWDGKCKNGYINGNGTLMTEDRDSVVQVCEGTYIDGWENGNGKCTKNFNKINLIYTATGTFLNGQLISGLNELESADGKVTIEGSFNYFKNNDVSGHGKIYYDNAEYLGEFL